MSDWTALADAVLIAIERADLDKRNFGLADLRNELPALALHFTPERLKSILVAVGCHCANGLVATWVCARPDDRAPLLALSAAQAWLAEPTPEHAARSASLSQAALHSFARTRGAGRSPSWPAHSWFARACAWLADAPQYGWQSVAALLGLIKAGTRQCLANELANQMRRLTQEKD